MTGTCLLILVAAAAARARADTEWPTDSVDRFLVAQDRDIAQPVAGGRWLVYHVGRDGQFVYNLRKRELHDKIRQYQRICYGVNDSIIFSFDPQQDSGWLYRMRNKHRRGFPYRRFGDMSRMWMSGPKFVYARQYISPTTRERAEILYVCDMSARWRQASITRSFDPESVSIGGDHVVWYDPNVNRRGIHGYDINTRRSRRLVEVNGAIRPDTDGANVVWFTRESAWRYDLATGKTHDLLEMQLVKSCTGVKVDGDWIAWTDADWNLFVMHLPSGRYGRITNSDDKGVNRLIDITGNFVIWQNADKLMAAQLDAPEPEPIPEPGPDADSQLPPEDN
jgi:hypothetical protein